MPASTYDVGTYDSAQYDTATVVGPVISNIVATPSTTNVTITWTTDIAASSQVDYGLTASYGSSTPVTDVSPRVTSHSVLITGLTAGTLYHFRVTSVDASSNSTSSGDNTFTTNVAAGPVISNVSATPTSTGATITWTTDVISSSQVDYGLTTSYSNNTPITDTSPRVVSHTVILSSLTASTLYHYRVTSTNGSGNTTTTGDFTFTTSAAAGPVITNVNVTRTQTTAQVTWTTDIIASSQVQYGLSVSYGTLTPVTDTSPRVTSHTVNLTGLTAATLYHYRVRSIDGSANETISVDNIFTTLGTAPVAGANRPVLLVDVDFTSNATAVPVWTDITSFVREVRTSRGRQMELDRIRGGTLALLLDNQDRRFDPNNTASPYAPFVLPLRRVRVRATWNSVVYPVFQGFVESWPQQWQAQGRVGEVAVTANDGFMVFNVAKLNDYYPEELAGSRITSVLNAINWGEGQAWVLGDAAYGILGTTTLLSPIGGKTISAGTTPVQAMLVEDTTALTHIQAVEDTDGGLFFVTANGTAKYLDRSARIAPPYNTSQATFGDGGGSELPYADLQLDTSPVWNEVRFERTGGLEQVATDALSRTQYYPRTLQHTNLLNTTDAQVLTLAAYILNRYKDPGTRISAMTMAGARSPSLLWPQILGREIGDRITIVRRPPGGGSPIVQDSLIEGIDHSATPDQWMTVFWTSPGSTQSYWILGDPTAGILGTSTRLSF